MNGACTIELLGSLDQNNDEVIVSTTNDLGQSILQSSFIPTISRNVLLKWSKSPRINEDLPKLVYECLLKLK